MIGNDHVEPFRSAHLRDAGAHLPGADDPYHLWDV
jgi:hypothetical protein